MVINKDGFVLVGRRADMPGEPEGDGQWWQMPQGGIDASEEPRRAALRELYEETGIRSVAVIGETRDWLIYDLPPALVGVAWGGRFRGQRQKWFAVRFHGMDEEVDIGPKDGHPAEFEAWRWSPVEDLVKMIVPFKRDVYAAVVNELGGLAQPLRSSG
jgi:putative (di)nucleoside polyphosphate hydrolase